MISGSEIKKLRKGKKWNQQQLADVVGVTKTTVLDWEKDRYSPTGENVKNLARALEVSILCIMGEKEGEAPITIEQLPERERATFRPLPGGLVALGNIVFVPKISAEYTAHCGGSGVAYGEITEFLPTDFEVIAQHKLGPIDPFRPPFALCTDGSSMVDFGIPPETAVIVNQAVDIAAGTLVLVEINGNPVIKKIYPRPDGGGKLLSSDGRNRLTREDIEMNMSK